MTSAKLIQVKNLKKHYNKGAIRALDDVSVDINKGDVMVVIGPSGSGKSTLLRSLNLLEVPTDGEVIFHNIDITKKSFINKQGKKEKVDINLHRQKMGMVFQHFNLFPHMTILDNMILAPVKVKHMSKEEAKEKALTAAEGQNHAVNMDRAMYDAWLAYTDLQDAGYNCYVNNVTVEEWDGE